MFATDGYPAIEMSLGATEAYLAEHFERDPLRIGRHRSTKGVAPDALSFDDRAFVSVARA